MRALFPAFGTAFLVASTAAANAQAGCPEADRARIDLTAEIADLEGEHRSGYINLSVPEEQKQELHIVGSYEGSGHVHVGMSSKPVVLVLASYETSRWRLDADPRARIERIYLLGLNSEQRIAGAPDSAEIINLGRCTGTGYAYEWKDDNGEAASEEFLSFPASVRSLTGLTETSFQGAYTIGVDFVVPADANALFAASPDPTEQGIGTEQPAVGAPSESDVRSTTEVIATLVDAGKLPIGMPQRPLSAAPDDPLDQGPIFGVSGPPPLTIRNFGECGNENYLVLGSEIGDIINCSWGDQFILSGPGEDVISDSWGNDVVNPGPQSDIIHLGWGFDILVLEQDWGEDAVSKTCHEAVLSAENRERLDWIHPYANFIVFGAGIRPADMVWESAEVLTHPPSGSRLILQDSCFSFVFTEEGEFENYAPPRPRGLCLPSWFLCLREYRLQP